MWISSDFEKKDNMYNATENYFVTVIRNILRMKRLGCILCMPHKWTRDSKYSCRRTKIKIFAPPVQIPIALFSLSTKFFDPLSSLPVNSTPHEILFRTLLPYVIG